MPNTPCHLLDLQSLSDRDIHSIFAKAHTFLTKNPKSVLSQKIIGLLFFEPSTRTRASFEIAIQKLGGYPLVLDMKTASTTKGESIQDTVENLQAMGVQAFVIRHQTSGVLHELANALKVPASLINAGDGKNAHPTQGLLDVFTILQHRSNLENVSIAIIGDLLHSRVARSQIELLKRLGVSDIRAIGPTALLPDSFSELGVRVFRDLKIGLAGVDCISLLRIQKERMEASAVPETDTYHACFGLNHSTLQYAKPDAIVLHPGPINRGIEITSEVADGPQSVILEQVRNGVAIRMAVLDFLLG